MDLHKDRGISPEKHIAVMLLRRSIKGGSDTAKDKEDDIIFHSALQTQLFLHV